MFAACQPHTSPVGSSRHPSMLPDAPSAGESHLHQAANIQYRCARVYLGGHRPPRAGLPPTLPTSCQPAMFLFALSAALNPPPAPGSVMRLQMPRRSDYSLAPLRALAIDTAPNSPIPPSLLTGPDYTEVQVRLHLPPLSPSLCIPLPGSEPFVPCGKCESFPVLQRLVLVHP